MPFHHADFGIKILNVTILAVTFQYSHHVVVKNAANLNFYLLLVKS